MGSEGEETVMARAFSAEKKPPSQPTLASRIFNRKRHKAEQLKARQEDFRKTANVLIEQRAKQITETVPMDRYSLRPPGDHWDERHPISITVPGAAQTYVSYAQPYSTLAIPKLAGWEPAPYMGPEGSTCPHCNGSGIKNINQHIQQEYHMGEPETIVTGVTGVTGVSMGPATVKDTKGKTVSGGPK